jgi:hypothetical protein
MPNVKNSIASLRKRSARVLRLPREAQAVVERYADLCIMGAHAACPYHINCRLFSKNRALLGKGRPEEIEAAAEDFFRRFNTSIKPGESEKLQAALRDYGIGIDCSGFVAWVLHELTLRHCGKAIWNCVRFPSVKRHAVSRFRPLENISAALLTGERNSHTVADICDILPGDMIRALKGGHVIVVTEVGVDAKDKALYFEYYHSTAGGERWNGVRHGLAIIREPSGYLLDQEWIEGASKIAPALAAVRIGEADSRIVRLRALVAAGFPAGLGNF